MSDIEGVQMYIQDAILDSLSAMESEGVNLGTRDADTGEHYVNSKILVTLGTMLLNQAVQCGDDVDSRAAYLASAMAAAEMCRMTEFRISDSHLDNLLGK